VIPVGVTKETVENISGIAGDVACIVAVTVPGLEEEKKPILAGLEALARMLGAEFYSIVVAPGSVESVVELYRVLKRVKAGEIVVAGTTGSRYLLPVLMMVLLKLWRERKGIRILLLHGVEGGGASLVPLAGFVSPALKVTRVQRRVLDIVYSSNKPVSGRELIEKHGFTRSVYYVLADLERKGLLSVKRGRIERTFTGEVFYRLLEEDQHG